MTAHAVEEIRGCIAVGKGSGHVRLPRGFLANDSVRLHIKTRLLPGSTAAAGLKFRQGKEKVTVILTTLLLSEDLMRAWGFSVVDVYGEADAARGRELFEDDMPEDGPGVGVVGGSRH